MRAHAGKYVCAVEGRDPDQENGMALQSLAAAPAQTLPVVSILGSAIAVATVLGALFMAAGHDAPPTAAREEVGHVWFAGDVAG
jgi:hypothetical protein